MRAFQPHRTLPGRPAPLWVGGFIVEDRNSCVNSHFDMQALRT